MAGILESTALAIRRLRRTPAFFVLAVGSTAVGFAASSTVFGILQDTFLRVPSGVKSPGELRRLRLRPERLDGMHSLRTDISYPEYRAVAEAIGPGNPIAGYQENRRTVLEMNHGSSHVGAEYVVGDYFAVVGVRAAAGRLFGPDEFSAEAKAPVAVVSERYAVATLGGLRAAIGQHLKLGSNTYVVIGVTEPGFRGLDLNRVDVWFPMGAVFGQHEPGVPWYGRPNGRLIDAIIRLRQTTAAGRIEVLATTAIKTVVGGVGDDSVNAILTDIARGQQLDFAADQQSTTIKLWILSLVILLISVLNLSNLMLARGLERKHEIAVQVSLGVQKMRLAYEAIAESLAITLAASIVGMIVAVWTGSGLRASLFPSLDWPSSPLNPHLALVTTGIALVTAVGVAVLTTLRVANVDPATVLSRGAGQTRQLRGRTHTLLLVAEAGFCVILLTGTGLVLESLHNVTSIDVGYDVNRIILGNAAVRVDAGVARSTIATELRASAGEVARIPGVEGVALADILPMSGMNFENVFLSNGTPAPHVNDIPPLVTRVSAEYLRVVGIQVLAGRGFTNTDRMGEPLVAVIDRVAAAALWPGQDPVGKCVLLGSPKAPCRTIVGLVSDAHYSRIIEPPSAHLYLPLDQDTGIVARGMVARIKDGANGSAVSNSIRSVLARNYGAVAVPVVEPMGAYLAPQLDSWRLNALLFVSAGFTGLLVAAAGMFSYVSYSIRQRKREFGIRIALGAPASRIFWDVVRWATWLVAVGSAIGIAVSLILGAFVASQLYGTTPYNVQVLLAAPLVMLIVAIGACLGPAWRAARTDPRGVMDAQ